MTVPAVSVILPVFNGEKYIGRTIASVLAQTFADWELIVIDDGSTDNTPQILASLSRDARLKLIRQVNQGASAARNTGLAAAVGDYIAFLDADDLWRPIYLERMLASLWARPEAELAFAGWQYINSDDELLPQTVIPFDGNVERAQRELVWHNAILPSAAVARRPTLLELGGFDHTLKACEDWDMWLRLKLRGVFIAVPEILTLYRAHSESRTDDIQNIEREQLRLNEKYVGRADGDPGSWEFDKQRAIGSTYFVSGLGYLRTRQAPQGFEKIIQAISIWPGLLADEEFYYELGCAYQPRGLRGTASGLDLNESAALIRSVLADQNQNGRLAFAYVTLSQLALVTGNRWAALRFALESWWRSSPAEWPAAGRAIMRALLPQSVRTTLRALRTRLVG